MEVIFGIFVLFAFVWLIARKRGKPQPGPSRPAENSKLLPLNLPNNRSRAAPPRPAPTVAHPSQTEVKGKCYVIDGDTIVINKVHIRLFGIDAPELEDPYGKNAKWALVRMCKGQVIRAEFSGDWTYERAVAKCFLSDGRDLSEEMVKQGQAIDWPKFSGGIYRQFEVDGIRKKLWRCDALQKGRLASRIPD